MKLSVTGSGGTHGDPRTNRRRVRDYPPLTIAAGVAVVILALLPSGLNLPTADPGQTLEYAPVPPDDEVASDSTGNFSAAGLAGSGIGTGRAPSGSGGDPADGIVEYRGAGKNPSTKRCVGSPPRQTEDPLSPPCVAYFAGDNGGGTARGVSADEIRILVYFDWTRQYVTSEGSDPMPPPGTIIDLAEPPESDEHLFVRLARAYTRHFTERYQTYGRLPHVFVHVGNGNKAPEGRRADAADGAARTDPFAIISNAAENADAYVTEWARMNRVVFLGTNFASTQPESYYRSYSGRIWSYSPSIERQADLAADYLCSKLVPFPSSFAGSPELNGRGRVIGLFRPSDHAHPDRIHYGLEIKARLENCGARIAAEAGITAPNGSPDTAASDMARFRQEGVTTVVWVDTWDGGVRSKAAGSLNYRPEWMIAMAGFGMDSFLGNRAQDPSVWRHARAITLHLRTDKPTERPCFTAAREAEPSIPEHDVINYGCDLFIDMRQLFIGVQVAGPRLTVSNVDKGFHAIPAVASTDPRVHACYYEPGDYTCVKDGQAQWWDPSATAPDGKPGCMRMMEGGRRYRIGAWPPGDVDAQRSDSDPCNLQGRDFA